MLLDINATCKCQDTPETGGENMEILNNTLRAGLLTRRYCNGEGRFGVCFRYMRTEVVFFLQHVRELCIFVLREKE